jgi:GrpB-like predicted nucleotidyltransferase (UPF0157 family)
MSMVVQPNSTTERTGEVVNYCQAPDVRSSRRIPPSRRLTADPEPALGLASKTVRVVPYDARWPALFAAEEARIRTALDGIPLELEHVGSTSVPGLAAKPIIDIMAGRLADVPAERVIPLLVKAGYEHRGDRGLPGREFFRRGDPRSYHVHLVDLASHYWREHLGFRDRLRADPATLAEYASLKRALAARFPFDREKYIEGKADFIQGVIADTFRK